MKNCKFYLQKTINILIASSIVVHKSGIRRHGYQFPPHPLQVLTIIIFIVDFLTYYLIDMISLSSNLALVVVCSLIFFVISMLVVYYWYEATIADPSDPTIQL
jgi:hypothetical protein